MDNMFYSLKFSRHFEDMSVAFIHTSHNSEYNTGNRTDTQKVWVNKETDTPVIKVIATLLKILWLLIP